MWRSTTQANGGGSRTKATETALSAGGIRRAGGARIEGNDVMT